MGLEAGWKIRIRLVEIREGGFRFSGESGEFAIPFSAYFLGSNFLLGLTVLIEHVQHFDLPVGGIRNVVDVVQRGLRGRK